MDLGYKVDKTYPRKNANIFSKLLFTWTIPFSYKCIKKGMNMSDLFKTVVSDSSDVLGDRLEANWENELIKKGKNANLLTAVSNTFLCEYMVFGMINLFLYCVVRVFQPLLLGLLLRLFTGKTEIENTTQWKYITGAILVCLVFLFTFCIHHVNFGQRYIGMKVRIAMSTLIYRKLLKLSEKSFGDSASGKVVNLLANDVSRFDNVAAQLHFFWITPIQAVIISYLIWRAVSIAAVAGIVTLLMFTIPIHIPMGKLTSKYRGKVAVRTDYRVRIMREIISGIKVIKMYAWEKPFEKLVQLARIDELKMIRRANYVKAVFLTIMVFTDRIILYATLITFVLTDNVLSSDITYTLSPLITIFHLGLAISLPMAIEGTAETIVVLRRLKEFLLIEEKKESYILYTEERNIGISNVSARWSEKSGTVSDINLNVPSGSLCALVGPVGAGKSSILQILLGELPPDTGEIQIGGKIAYASQEAWLFGSTVKGNILFGQEYDKGLYDRVVETCALREDFNQFPQGDQTLVGERGISLSGGQRARINLARTIYRQADIYLLDDPLSAVDTNVGKHLFEECIVNHLKGTTRILITHQLQYLKQADLIVVLKNGKIEAQGTFHELSKSNIDFGLSQNILTVDENPTEKSSAVEDHQVKVDPHVKKSLTSTNINENKIKFVDEMIVPSKSIMWDYIGAIRNICAISIVIGLILIAQVVSSGNDYFVAWWTGQEESKNAEGSDADDFISRNTAVYIYSSLIGGFMVLSICRSYSFFRCASTASKNLHAKMFNCLLKTPMRFFDTNPSGRILNRFSKDTGSMDETLPRVFAEAVIIMLGLLGSLIVIIITNYWMAIPIVALLAVFFIFRKMFVIIARSVKHIEGVAKSPVFSLLNSTISGLSTIRAYDAQMNLISEFDEYQNVHTSSWILVLSTASSFGLWLDLFSAIFFTVTVFTFILLNDNGGIGGAMAGLAISQAMSIPMMLQVGLRQTTELVNQLISVERIMMYTKLDEEGPFESPSDKKPAIDWPKDGEIHLKHVSLRYDIEEAPVLKDLNIQIMPGEKVGIVGRTGAGKSSLITVLFRLAPLEGSITVDDLDIQEIGLHDVRSKITIIPQEPVLFSATMRYNLDPFDEFSDEDLWSALIDVELKEAIPYLEFKVTDGGGNFSVGERQLICLARAIIRRNKILVLDEATANVDPRTDALIQNTIRKKFKSCTVLTIAHRLNTIMDSDKVLVMDSGVVAEFNHPHTLLQNLNGQLTKLVMETGPTMATNLRDVARKCFEEKSIS